MAKSSVNKVFEQYPKIDFALRAPEVNKSSVRHQWCSVLLSLDFLSLCKGPIEFLNARQSALLISDYKVNF